jgi:hypothetical protein
MFLIFLLHLVPIFHHLCASSCGPFLAREHHSQIRIYLISWHLLDLTALRCIRAGLIGSRSETYYDASTSALMHALKIIFCLQCLHISSLSEVSPTSSLVPRLDTSSPTTSGAHYYYGSTFGTSYPSTRKGHRRDTTTK